jgi:uncharacterized protein YukE
VTDCLGLTARVLRSTAGDLHDVSSWVKGVMSSLRAELAGTGDNWCRFRTNRYLAQVAWVLQSVDAETDLLDDCSKLLGQAADAFEQSDLG